jgi:hypothetical protein
MGLFHARYVCMKASGFVVNEGLTRAYTLLQFSRPRSWPRKFIITVLGLAGGKTTWVSRTSPTQMLITCVLEVDMSLNVWYLQAPFIGNVRNSLC